MKKESPSIALSRRDFVRASSALAASVATGVTSFGKGQAAEGVSTPRTFLTPADQFRDVSRGNPKPHTLKGEALVQARLTPDTWRLEITTDDTPNPKSKDVARISQPLTMAGGNALDLPALLELGRKHGVKFIKAMQCLNIPTPLGQGLWEGVPLREVLRLCGSLRNVRRIYYSGFHNNDPKQVFQSSLSYTQAMETPPGELPAFIAHRLNGEPLTLERGGPVRMIVPWAHGFKSIKWLQRIVLTNDYQANDTYALQNNDPESHLKTAAYLDKPPEKLRANQEVVLTGLVICGLSGLKHVEYSLEKVGATSGAEEHWVPGRLEAPPKDWNLVLPAGVSSKQLLGFDSRTGRPATWPLRYGMVSWTAHLGKLPPGKYAARARAVDLNGFAQPEPRPMQKTGRNALEVREFEVV